MPRPAQALPIYQKNRSWYVDLRRYRDVGGDRMALMVPGEPRKAVTDRRMAAALAREQIARCEAARRDRRQVRGPSLSAAAGPFLVWKATQSDASDRTLKTHERNLAAAIEFFERHGERSLDTIRPSDVEAWLDHLRKTVPARRAGQGVTNWTLLDRLKSLSLLYRWAAYRELIAPGYNPVAALMGEAKPSATIEEARFFQPTMVALLLEAARVVPAEQMPFQYPLVATFAYTGDRRREVLGLERQDVDFARNTITFRPNAWRGLKTKKSARVVPLWPELAAILKPWIARLPPGKLLFPSYVSGQEQMLQDPKRLWRRLERATRYERREPLDPARVGAKGFRNAYAAVRLQTLDRGAPVAVYTVARELGHSTTRMREDIYGHLGQVAARSDEVRFALDERDEWFHDRLVSLRVMSWPESAKAA
jgi:integrase